MMKEVVSTMSSIGKSASKIADIINVIDSIVKLAAAAAASLEQQAHELVGAISIFNVAQNTAKLPATVVQLTDKRTALTDRSNLYNSNSHLKKKSKIAAGDRSDQWSKF